MGYGNYSYDAHQALSQGRSNLPRQAVFSQTSCHPLMNPKGVKMRESRDSADHPQSIGIVFALDVTGSMGQIPELLAKQQLPNFMKILMDCGVKDPQLLFMAVGDATCDKASLQFGQFESSAKEMDQWLTWSFLEGGGGGQNTESYELALYLLAHHTDMDCWSKRKKRGYIFMTGDELPYPFVSRHQVESLIGDTLGEDVSVAAAVAAVSETFETFFLIPDHNRRDRCERTWRGLLGDHVIAMDGPVDTCYVAASILALSEGLITDVSGLAPVLRGAGASEGRINAIVQAVTPFAEARSRAVAREPSFG